MGSTYHSLNAIAAQLKNGVFVKYVKESVLNKEALILIFWKCFESNEFNFILLFFVYS